NRCPQRSTGFLARGQRGTAPRSKAIGAAPAAPRPKCAKIRGRPRGNAMTNGSVMQWQGEGAVRDRLNRPVRDLRISVIDRCNYRCPYCMPADVYGEGHKFLPRSHWLTPGEIKRVAGLFLKLGVTKLRLTGG